MTSWSGIRKTLEKDLLCPALRGRVQYFLTHYHAAHDDHGRFALRVDGEEIIKANDFLESTVYYLMEKARRSDGWEEGVGEEQALHQALRQAATTWDVKEAIHQYMNQDISLSLASSNPYVRLFAVLDRRVGKGTLLQMAQHLPEEPAWLKKVVLLRLKAEGIQLEVNK